MILESPRVRLARGALAAFLVASAYGAAIAMALHDPPIDNEVSQTGGAFVIELAELTSSPDEERRNVAVGETSDEVSPVAASLPQQASTAEAKPIEDLPPVPEFNEPPPDDAFIKPPEEQALEDVKPEETKVAQAQDSAAQTPVEASEAAAPQLIENAQETSETPRGLNTGLSSIDRRAIENWQRDLVLHLNRHKRYPSQAREERRYGIVNVAFTMDREGRVHDARIAKSSGYDLLDSAAIAMLNKASPLPVPPGDITADKIELVVPVNYRWKN